MRRRSILVFGVAAAMILDGRDGRMAAAAAEDPALVLRRLNQDYVTAYLKSDVARYRELLADDFAAILPNGNLVDRQGFLAAAAQPARMGVFHVLDVDIRVFGNYAIVRARTSYRRDNGPEGSNRYSDVYALRNGRWQAIWGQVTPVLAPPETSAAALPSRTAAERALRLEQGGDPAPGALPAETLDTSAHSSTVSGERTVLSHLLSDFELKTVN